VALDPCAFNGQDDAFGEKLGRAIGNLQALDVLSICNPQLMMYDDDDDEAVLIPAWEILARILSHVRQSITLTVCYSSAWRVEESRSLARAIRGNPTITRFVQDYDGFRN
jgi:hypothetical protein